MLCYNNNSAYFKHINATQRYTGTDVFTFQIGRFFFFLLLKLIKSLHTCSNTNLFLHSFLPNHVVYKDTYQQKVFCGLYSDEGNMFLSACQGETGTLLLVFIFYAQYFPNAHLRHVQIHNKPLLKSCRVNVSVFFFFFWL